MAESTDSPTQPARERVYAAFADRSLDFQEAVDRALEIGRDRLGVEMGFLTQITEGSQTIVQSVGPYEDLQPGARCPLEQAYCRRTVEVEGSLSVEDAEAAPDVSAAAFEAFELGTYLGCKVYVGDDIYGTVCFADAEPRSSSFDESDRLFVELVARLVGQGLERKDYERTIKAHEYELERETHRLETILETSFDIIFRLDPAGAFEYVSPAVSRHLGYDPEALVGEPATSFISERSVDEALAAIGQVFDGETVEGLEIEFRRRSGDVATLEVNGTPVREDGDVVLAQGVARDVSARRAREEELRLKNRAIDDAELGITIADVGEPDAPIVYANERFASITGYPVEQVIGRPQLFLGGPATEDDAVRDAVSAGEPVEVELVHYRRRGVPFWNHLTLAPIEDDDGTVTHYVAFHQDDTRRRRTEQVLEVLNRVLRHNIRNDLNVVLGHAQTLGDRGGDAVDQAIAHIDSVGQKMLTVAERARELEKLTVGEHDPVAHDPATLLEGLSERHRGPAVAIDVVVDTSDRFYAGPDFERALKEVLENAIVHDDEPPTSVTVTARTVGDEIELRVEDDGPGIPENQANVVEFGRETPMEHSLGLGLWITNWMTTQYGGSFQITPAPGGRGTVATLRLPVAGAASTGTDVRPTTLFR